jgi:hypothetical protein
MKSLLALDWRPLAAALVLCVTNLAPGQLNCSDQRGSFRDKAWSLEAFLSRPDASRLELAETLLSEVQRISANLGQFGVSAPASFVREQLALLTIPTDLVDGTPGVFLQISNRNLRPVSPAPNSAVALLPSFSSSLGTVTIFSAMGRAPVRLKTLMMTKTVASSIAVDLESVFPPTLNTLFAGMTESREAIASLSER